MPAEDHCMIFVHADSEEMDMDQVMTWAMEIAKGMCLYELLFMYELAHIFLLR